MASVPKEEARWRAESDARTLMEADVIRKDPMRKKAAAAAARKLSEEKTAEARAMQSVARMSTKAKKRTKVRKVRSA